MGWKTVVWTLVSFFILGTVIGFALGVLWRFAVAFLQLARALPHSDAESRRRWRAHWWSRIRSY
ncbi:hypothetical protein [Streptomyces sp. NPDC051994]|uniref:hypothetical protein n=1 Tax=unclassified Streptomyces TaxID=2593676 RepID=UPI00342788DF